MNPISKDYKPLILTDMLIAFNGSRSPTDGRFARAHENITGIEIFQREYSLITFIPSDNVDANKVISDIASVIAVNVEGNYLTSTETASSNDICHFIVDCGDYSGTVNLLQSFINRDVNYCAVFQLTNINQITPDLLSILSIALTEHTFNGKLLSSSFFIATLNSDHKAELSDQAAKLIEIGFLVKGE